MNFRRDGRIPEVETFLQSYIVCYLRSVFWPAQDAVAVSSGVDLKIERWLEIVGYYLYGRSIDFVLLVRA